MAQNTQFNISNGPESMNVKPADLAAYLAAGWRVLGICYSIGGEDPDTSTLFLMNKGSESIYVKAGDVFAYVEVGYSLIEILYGSTRIAIQTSGRQTLRVLDTPDFSSAEVGTVGATTVAVTFSTDIVADDYAAGVTITVDDVGQSIASATRQTDHKVVYYVIPAVANGSVVTWSYDDATGGISSAADGSHMDDVTAGEVTNNVPA